MKKKSRILIRIFLLVGLPLCLAEVILGYWNFRMVTHSSGFRHTYKVVRNHWKQTHPEAEPSDVNPFFSAANETGVALHPIIDYSRGGGLFPFRHDYFGYRNETDLYLEKNRDYRLIVFTGGSEAFGYSHRFSIAENIEKILNERPGQRFRVLNLGMSGYCLPQELNAYLHLAYQLKPEIVISHTGYNDAMYALMEPAAFKELGLNFSKDVFDVWLPLLFEPKPGRKYGGWVLNEKGAETIVPAILSTLDKFKTVVESNGGKYLVGIQAYQPEEHLKQKPSDWSEKGKTVFEALQAEAPTHQFLSFQDRSLPFHDHIHTTDAGSVIIAKAYADQIASALVVSN